MIIPSHITIGAITYVIDMSQKIQDDCGYVDRDLNVIKIDRELSLEQKILTFWHEVIHCCNGEMDEGTVDMIAVLIQQVVSQLEDL